MTLDDIKASVDAGLSVYWKSVDHPVVKFAGEYRICVGAARMGFIDPDGVRFARCYTPGQGFGRFEAKDFFGALVREPGPRNKKLFEEIEALGRKK